MVIVKVETTLGEIAEVIGTDVFIVAGCRLATFADSSAAGILFGTNAAVVAGGSVWREYTAGFRGTRIVGTGVAIVTGEFARADTLPQVAMVTGGADIFVVAGGTVEQVHAALGRVA